MNDSEKKDAAEVLERAADLLWVKGRCQMDPVASDGTVCALGAIGVANGQIDYDRAVVSRLDGLDAYIESDAATALQSYLGFSRLMQVANWNDYLPITPENDAHVVDTMRHAAKTLRNEVEA